MKEALLDSLAKVWSAFHDRLIQVVPRLIALLLVVAVGWVLAAVFQMALRRGLKLARFDERCERSGFAPLLRRADVHRPPSELLARISFWVVLLSAAIFSLSALGVPVLDHMVSAFFLYLPRILVALVVLAAGYLLANFLGRAALLLAVNEELPVPRLVAGTVRILVNTLALVMALEQLGIGPATVTVAFAIAFGAFMLALALAFGLGGRDLARDLLARRLTRDQAQRDERHHL